MTSPQLNLLMIRVCDLEAAAALYRALGLTFERHQHGNGPIHYTCTTPDWVFELYPHREDEMSPTTVRFGFRVGNLHRLLADLERLGARIVSPPRPSPWGERAVIIDRDGYTVELIDAGESPV